MSFPRYPAYKPSGVEWLGEVPEHWEMGQSRRRFRLRNEPTKEADEQLTASQKHGIIRQAEFIESEGRRVVEVIKGQDILKHVEPGDFVISMRSFQGGLEYSEVRGCISSAYVILAPVKQVIPTFFSWLFKSQPYIQALQSTTNLVRDGQALRFSNFCQVDIPVIPPNEQLSIAAFLDHETAKIDALIAEQQRLIELLQEKRQAVISHAVTKGLNPHAPMKDSGVEWLGEVPEHWEVCRIKNVGKSVIGLTYSPSDVTEAESGIPVLRASNIQDGRLDWEDTVFVNMQIEPSLLLRPGDILICARSGSRDLIGKNILIAESDLAMTPSFGAFMTVLRCIDPPFLRWTLSSTIFKAQSGAYMSTTINQLTSGTLMGTTLALPPNEERGMICQYLDNHIAKVDGLVSECRQAVSLLQERRSALISAAVTGQIDVRGLVPEAEAA